MRSGNSPGMPAGHGDALAGLCHPPECPQPLPQLRRANVTLLCPPAAVPISAINTRGLINLWIPPASP